MLALLAAAMVQIAISGPTRLGVPGSGSEESTSAYFSGDLGLQLPVSASVQLGLFGRAGVTGADSGLTLAGGGAFLDWQPAGLDQDGFRLHGDLVWEWIRRTPQFTIYNGQKVYFDDTMGVDPKFLLLELAPSLVVNATVGARFAFGLALVVGGARGDAFFKEYAGIWGIVLPRISLEF